jgi:DNA polymerase elongation subunit (family B)
MIRSKGYAGRYSYFKGVDATEESEPEIKGLEFKRGDSLRLARKMQEEVIDLLLRGDDGAEALCVELVERWRRRVLEEPLALDDVKQSKRLSKSIREYKREKKKGTDDWSARPPHVEVAAILQERGRPVSSGVRIEFYLVDGSSSPAKYAPAEDWKGEVDRFGIWEDHVYPPTMRVLEACFPGTQWSRWEKVRPRRAPTAVGALFAAGQLARRPEDARARPAGKLRGRSPEPPAASSGQRSLFAAPHPSEAEERE